MQTELSLRDELKENKWWTFDAKKANELQVDAAKKYNLPVDKVITLNGVDVGFKLISPGKFGMGKQG